MKISRSFYIASAVIVIAVISVFLYFANSKTETEKNFQYLEVVSGADQCALPSAKTYEKVAVRALDNKSAPVRNLTVTAQNDKNSDLIISPEKSVTDSGGVAYFNVAPGKYIGDNYLIISPENAPEKSLKIRFVNGAVLARHKLEGVAGNVEQFSLKMEDASGAPRSGVKIFVNSSDGVAISQTELVTDADGIAATEITMPDKSGSSRINVEIIDKNFRAITGRILSFDPMQLLINVLGGLALFMLGMKMMSDGLSGIAGEKMKGILRFCTRNRFMALLAGAGVTAVIQSSSATTVMLIGFVNAGLMNLAQTIGVIFGANIGTTITAQIVAFDVSALSMPAIVLGLVLSFVKRGKIAEFGNTILGFGLLFFGMTLMGDELKVLSDFPSFSKFFQTFNCEPVNGVMPLPQVLGAIGIGLLATVIVQSSSATTGVVIVLGAGGLVNLYTAVALILGANIGTTITAQLAAIPANIPARQTALAHTLFNILGVLFVMIWFWVPWGDSGIPSFFYVVNMITEGNAFSATPENIPRHIANAHTIFNVMTALILLPFTNVLATVCEKLLPARTQKVKFQYLEPHLLESPALALRQTTVALGKMLKKSCRMIQSAVLDNFIPGRVDAETIEKLDGREERVDRYQREIVEYLAQIMRRKISPAQAEAIPGLMHCANDAERIADRAENIVTLTKRLESDSLHLSEPAKAELTGLWEELSMQMDYALNALGDPSNNYAALALKSEKTIARLAAASENAHISRMKSEECTPQTGIIYVELLSELIAVSRHLSNIAERAVI